jgi:hypothetical protein
MLFNCSKRHASLLLSTGNAMPDTVCRMDNSLYATTVKCKCPQHVQPALTCFASASGGGACMGLAVVLQVRCGVACLHALCAS